MRYQFLLAALIALSITLVPLSIAPKVQATDSISCTAPTTICWDNTSGGSWETIADWILPGGAAAGRIPTASDDVAIIGATSYVVTLSSVQTVHSLYIGTPTGGVNLDCTSSCTLTILAHTPGWLYDLHTGDIIDIAGNIINHAQFIDYAGTINIHLGGTFVNHNTLDISQPGSVVTNNGVFDEKCGASVVGGPISGTFVTESPCPTQVSTASGSPVSGTVTFQSELGAFTGITATALSSVSPAPPSGLAFPDGLFSFTISGLQTGATVTVTITLPSPLPTGDFSYWKISGGTWTSFTECVGGCAFLSSDRKTITLILTDGLSPDDSDLLANGVIVDPGGPAIPKASTSTSVSCVASSVTVGSGSTCTATVTGSSPTGSVSFTQGTPGTATVTFSPFMSCTLLSGSCSVTVTGSSVGSGSVTVTGSYGGDGNNLGSSGTFSLQVIAPAVVPEYPLGLPLLAVFMLVAYGLIKRRTRNLEDI